MIGNAKKEYCVLVNVVLYIVYYILYYMYSLILEPAFVFSRETVSNEFLCLYTFKRLCDRFLLM